MRLHERQSKMDLHESFEVSFTALSGLRRQVKVKQSRCGPGVAQRVPGSYDSQISWQRHRMVVRLSALCTGHLYLEEMLLVLISVRGWVDSRAIGRISCQWKIPMTPTGIEPATFRFVAQHLNHCATAASDGRTKDKWQSMNWKGFGSGRDLLEVLPRNCLEGMKKIRKSLQESRCFQSKFKAGTSQKQAFSTDAKLNCSILMAKWFKSAMMKHLCNRS